MTEEPLDLLVLAATTDRHATAVVEEVRSRAARARIFSLAELRATPFTLGDRALRIGAGSDRALIDSRTSVWWRQQGAVTVDGLADDDAALTEDEGPHVLLGALEAAGVRWVDDPFHVSRAELKLFQLAAARSLKVRTPESVVTNEVSAALAFVEARPTIAKPLSPGRGIAPYTAHVTADDAAHVEHFPSLLQERVDGAADVRVLVAGRSVLAWRRQREPDTLDWRAVDPTGSGFVAFENSKLAECSLAITSAVGCTVGALDWIQDKQGFVFLEINPRGRWLFLPGAATAAVSAIADHLLDCRTARLENWPSLGKRVWYDLLPAPKAPSADGSHPPTFVTPIWSPEVAAKPLALEVARSAHADARESIRVVEDKASRLVQVGLTLVAVALAVAAFQISYAASRSDLWWAAIIPAALAVTFIAVAVLGALQADRVSHFRAARPGDLAGHRQQSDTLVLLDIEEHGRQLCQWSAKKKQNDLMQSRAWFTRGLLALLVAGVVAAVSLGFASTTSSTPSPRPEPEPVATTSDTLDG